MFDQKTDYLALDFDGVIADSITECLILGHNAFVEFSKGGQKITSLKDLEDDKLTQSRRLRNFIRSGEDYVYISLALKERISIVNQGDFDDFKQKYSDVKSVFFQLFYQERERLSSNYWDRWLRMIPLYPGMQGFMGDFNPKEKLVVISTRKAEYVATILDGYGISLHSDNLFFADEKRNKRVIIHELLTTKNIPAESFYFVDDQIDTLIKVNDTEIHCFMAEWGYHNDDQLEKARKGGIKILGLQEFYSLFGKDGGPMTV